MTVAKISGREPFSPVEPNFRIFTIFPEPQDSVPSRLLRPGDLEGEGCLPGYFNFNLAMRTQLTPPRTQISNSSEAFMHSIVKSPLTHNAHEQTQAHYYGTASNNPQFMPYSSIPKGVALAGHASFIDFNRKEQPYLRRSESESAFSRIFQRAPGSTILQSFPDDFSTPSSPESDSHCTTYRTAAEQLGMGRTVPLYQCNSISTQTERSPFEEKFLFRESILLGCDLIAEVSHKMPGVSEIREYAEYIREKTIQSRAQNVCSRLLQGSGENLIISEYVKTFVKIADAWLDARNCFGTSEQCLDETCNLGIKEISTNYTEWMHSSRYLLNSIQSGLEKISKGGLQPSNRKVNENLQSKRCSSSAMTSAHNSWEHSQPPQQNWPLQTAPPPPRSTLSGPGGFWGYPPNPPCQCGVNPGTMKPTEQPQLEQYTFTPEQIPWYQTQGLFPKYPQRMGPSDRGDSEQDYLIPSSYDVPRTKITLAQKRNNISNAKLDCSKDRTASKGYIVTLINNGNRREPFTCSELKKEASDEQEMGRKEILTSESVIRLGSPRHARLKADEWLLASLGSRDEAFGEVTLQRREDDEDDSDSCSACDTAEGELATLNSSPQRDVKLKKNQKIIQQGKKRRFLTPWQATQIQEIVMTMWEYDLPEYAKFPVKNAQNPEYYKTVKHPIFLETVTNKTRNGIYETVEQFVHDCRRLLKNTFMFAQKNEDENEKASQWIEKFEGLLEEHFEQSQTWSYITGDPKELSYYPALRYVRKKIKTSKSVRAIDDTNTCEAASTSKR